MTAVEGLPTGACERLAEALRSRYLGLLPSSDMECWLQDAEELLPVVAELCDEARADELRVAAEALHVQRFNADEDPEARWPPGSPREVPLFYRGVLMSEHQLRARADTLTASQQPTCQQPHTVDDTTWRCLQPEGHDGQHEDSAGQRW